MPTPRLVAIVVLLAVLSGCQAKPDARYPEDLSACELLPRAEAIRVTDVGAKLSAAQPKETHVIVPYKYCLWAFKQSRPHWYSAYPKGPVDRRLTIQVTVYSRDRHGAEGASGGYDEQRSSQVRNGAAVADVSGLGEAAFVATDHFEGDEMSRVYFRRSNALVAVDLSGRDCCVDKTVVSPMPSATRRRLLLAAATAADRTLLGR